MPEGEESEQGGGDVEGERGDEGPQEDAVPHLWEGGKRAGIGGAVADTGHQAEAEDLLQQTPTARLACAFMSQIPGICLLKSTIRKELKDRVPLQLESHVQKGGEKKTTKKCWLVSVN